MNRMKKIVVILLSLCLILANMTAVLADPGKGNGNGNGNNQGGGTSGEPEGYDLVEDLGQVLIPFTVNWAHDTEADRPASVSLTLYSYTAETFSTETATVVSTADVSKDTNWSTTFDVTEQVPGLKYAVVVGTVDGYSETVHNDPNVLFSAPELEGLVKNPPCNDVNITAFGTIKSLVAAKKGNKVCIWTPEKLTAKERAEVSAVIGQYPGLNDDVESHTFISGFGIGSNFGMTVYETYIHFTAKSAWSWVVVGTYTRSLPEANAGNATLTMNPKVGSLTVSKTVAGNAPDTTKQFEFTITLKDTTINQTYGTVEFVNGEAKVSLAHGQSVSIPGLPNGMGYTVVETPADEYTCSAAENTISGTISDREASIAAFVNTRNTYGDLTVSKTVAGNGADTTKEFEFTITLSDKTVSGEYGAAVFTDGVATITLKNGETATIEDLPNGATYTVTEKDYLADGYIVTASSNTTGTIEGGATIAASFTNTRNAEGSLTITKKVTGNADVDPDMTFEFTIQLEDTTINDTFSEIEFVEGKAVITLAADESVVIEGLPNGMGYTITEADYTDEGYKLKEKSGDEGTISESAAAVVVFTNDFSSYGDLTITKTVAGNAGDKTKAFSFTITLDDTTIEGTFGDMIFAAGVATVELKDGESATAEGLPNGTGYIVAEASYTADGYVTTATGTEGTIVGNAEQTTAFINTRNVEEESSEPEESTPEESTPGDSTPEESTPPVRPVTPESSVEAVVVPQPETPAQPTTAPSDKPNTGDHSQPLLWGMLAMVSAMGTVMMAKYGKKRKYIN